jgi:adenine-specific DNA-methyltransferase
MMDELFGRTNFVATVVWQRRDGRPNDAIIGQAHDYLVVYARDIAKFAVARNRLLRTEEQEGAYRNPDNDPRGPWRNDNYTSNKSKEERPNSWFPILRPADGKEIWPKPHAVWRYSPETHARNVSEERLWWGPSGMNTMPKLKRFRSEVAGIVPMTWWPFAECGSTRNAKDELKRLFPGVEPFATPKPEKLLERILQITTNPGEVVLDCFLGSGTTAAVAQKMNRRWVGIERSSDTLSVFAIPRLEKVVTGDDAGGVTDLTGWRGGGGFRVLDVAPSMFTEDGGIVYLADWATNGRLAEVCAAQLHYAVEPDPPFAGRRGRMRLAVVDGLVNADAVSLLVKALPEDERLTVCGTAVDPEVRALLRELRPGSTARKIPQAILDDYRLARWVPRARSPVASGQSSATNESLSAAAQHLAR